jgi:sulfate adenylyltransferase subunit 1 (EFTu-like GTPase family)
MERLRFATVGSVDDGKSTLIGRLLYDSKSIFEDQLEHIENVSKRRGTDYVDLSLLTDGLRAERGTSQHQSAALSSPTAPATFSTRAT